MSGTSTYPAIKDTWIDQEAKKDKARAVDFNKVQDAIKAIEDTLGINPQGSVTDVVTRLGVILSSDGSIRHGTSFPSSPITGQPFYRTDVEQLYIWTGTTWQPTSSIQNLFSAYNSSNQGGVGTDNNSFDVSYDTEEFDTGSCFSSSTFVAPSTGKYLFTASILFAETTNFYSFNSQLYLKKNGSNFTIIGGGGLIGASGTQAIGMGGSAILDLTTNDAISVYVTSQNTISANLQNQVQHGIDKGRFTGCKLST